MISAKIRARARKVKLLLMDVDGVLTDGRIYYLINPRGGFYETKTFHSRDGLGIRLAHQAGLKTGILSGRSSPVVEHRAKELGIHFVQEAALEKLEPFEMMLRGYQEANALLQRLNQTLEQRVKERTAALKASQEELRVLELIRHRLEIEQLIAAGIERGAKARFQTL